MLVTRVNSDDVIVLSVIPPIVAECSICWLGSIIVELTAMLRSHRINDG